MSLDGYIAKPNDDLSFLSAVEQEGEDYGYESFISTVSTVILGRKTYDWVLKNAEFPHKEKETYVLTRTKRENNGKVKFFNGELSALIAKLKMEPGMNIFCDGGAETAGRLLLADLIDELRISVIPIILGNGVSLFKNNTNEIKLKLISSKSYPAGLIQICYRRLEFS